MSFVGEVDSCDALAQSHREQPLAAPRGSYERLKRVLDLCVACGTLVLLSPILVVAALAIKVTSRGPVLFRGTVIGRQGQPFTYYKLRTMVVDGDDAAHRHFIQNYVADRSGRARRDDAPPDGRSVEPGGESTADRGARRVYKLTDDSRITPVGRILRKTSLDEVAQMINVIRGEMSIVGPRPPVPYEYQLYNDYHKQRLAVLPGITGLAQVRARSQASFEQMVAIDLEYIRHRSAWNDLAIMARTMWVVLSGRGAH